MGNSSSTKKPKEVPVSLTLHSTLENVDTSIPNNNSPLLKQTPYETPMEGKVDGEEDCHSEQPETTEVNPAHLLLKACLNGEIDQVKTLESQGVPLNPAEILDPLTYADTSSPASPAAKPNFISPLIAAIKGGQKEVVEYLLSAGCCLSSTFQQYSESNGDIVSGVTPLMLACQRKHLGIIAHLVKAKAITFQVDSDKNTILHYVCRQQQQQQQYQSPQFKKKKKKKKKKKRNDIETDSTVGCDDSQDDITETLLLLQNLNVLTSDLPGHSNIRNNTALHSLAYFNNVPAMRILLSVMYGTATGTATQSDSHTDSKSPPDQEEKSSLPLHNVHTNHKEEDAQRQKEDDFLTHPPPAPSLKTLLRNDVGMTPLHIATLRNSPGMMRLLLCSAFDPGVTEQSGMDVFQLARVVNLQQASKNKDKGSTMNERSTAVSDDAQVTANTQGSEETILEVLAQYQAAVAKKQEEKRLALLEQPRSNNQKQHQHQHQERQHSYDEDEDDDEDDFDMNASSITYENTLDDDGDEYSGDSRYSKPFHKVDNISQASDTTNTASSVRRADPYPKALLLTKKQLLLSAAASMMSLGRNDHSGKKKPHQITSEEIPISSEATAPACWRGREGADITRYFWFIHNIAPSPPLHLAAQEA